ncbi:leucyl aminopeptidase family protein [Pseudoalteromonas luteoviolacea]|uniref:M17 family metallopeptidase n=1 Tax=Pseudoalteromonas luteoviolacea TaxID=43657 RepID=UPI001B358CCE|nr:leucyl aminopeptidase family protein [Pseudoalteromonas luteoviolacea]MBQ4812972.1 leucyl aminopeptidase family protein [Pseudoalteromonas luteoviolacea]
MSFPLALPASSWQQNDADAVIVITSNVAELGDAQLNEAVAPYLAVDARLSSQANVLLAEGVPGKRLIVAPTGPLNRDFDDVRRFFEAGQAGIAQAKAAGAVKPVIVLAGVPQEARYANALQVAFLGACQMLWQPLEAREYRGAQIEPVEQAFLVGADEALCSQLNAIAAGQYAARDLCGTEPERMAPPRFADYCVELFAGTSVSVEVISDRATIDRDYPMLGTVARASYAVERHHPRVVKMEYVPEGDVERTLMFVGKGLVYDTGGADLKVGGFMAGMSRDKGGAASVAGFMKAVAQYQPKGVKVVAYLAVVRNSIGSDCFVPDEIIETREGVRVRIGNTDAEGRLAMGDLLSEIKDAAKSEINPELFTVATLTGHAARAMGPYSAYVENGPARANSVSRLIADQGDLWADCAEVSRSRREDYDFVKPRTLADDVLSSNNAPSAVTARGHQFPMAFLAIVGGLDKHGCDSEQPIPYVHMDIAGSGVEGGDWQHGKPTAATVSSLFARYCL